MMSTRPNIMNIIALTGGLGSGKSEAAKQFEKLGIPVVDTDVIAHELTRPGQPVLEDIIKSFGQKFITTEGALDRPKLRAHVFEDVMERLKLEAILHPAIYKSALKKLSENQHQYHPIYQVLVVPLLFESHRYDGVANKSLVIDCDKNLQIKRAMARSQMTKSVTEAIIDSQVPSSVRRERASEVIENNGSIAELIEKINKFHEKYIKTCIVSK